MGIHTFKIEVQGRPLVGRIRHLSVFSSVATWAGPEESLKTKVRILLAVPFVVALLL